MANAHQSWHHPAPSCPPPAPRIGSIPRAAFSPALTSLGCYPCPHWNSHLLRQPPLWSLGVFLQGQCDDGRPRPEALQKPCLLSWANSDSLSHRTSPSRMCPCGHPVIPQLLPHDTLLQVRTRTHAHAHTHTYTLTHTLTHAHKHTHSHTHTHALLHIPTLTHTHTPLHKFQAHNPLSPPRGWILPSPWACPLPVPPLSFPILQDAARVGLAPRGLLSLQENSFIFFSASDGTCGCFVSITYRPV